MSFRCRFGCRSDHVGFPRNNFTVKMHAFRERRLNNFLFSNLVLLIAVSKKNVLAILVAARGVSPHLNASSQHLYLSLLLVFFIFKVHTSTYDLDVVLDVVQDVVPHLNGIPSKHPELGAAVRRIMNPRITQNIAQIMTQAPPVRSQPFL